MSKFAESDLLLWLPDDVLGSVVHALLHGDVASKRALMQLAQTSQPLRKQIRSLAKALKPALLRKKKSELRRLSEEERRCIKFAAAMAVTLIYDPAALIGAPPESIAHALAPSPWCEWHYARANGASDTVEKDEATTENYLAGLAHSWRELASLPPAVVAIAASDQTDEQRTFFVAQSVGEMIIERDRFLGADGAARLGEILAVRPLMKPSDFVTSLHLATEIQERRLEEFGGPPESESSPLALIASWCKSALQSRESSSWRLSFEPAKWTGRVSSLEQVALRINNGEATCTFSRVVSAILHAMPSKVEAGLNQDHAETPAENGTTRIVVVPRGTAEQYHILTQWLCKAVRAVDVAVTRAAEQGHGSASTTADEVQLRMAALHQAACLSKALCEAIQEEHPLSATAY